MTEPLSPDCLLAHARAAARSDEDRHPNTPLHQDGTLRGWGNAALMDLEWTSQRIYSSSQHVAYRDAYLEEYRRARSLRERGAADSQREIPRP